MIFVGMCIKNYVDILMYDFYFRCVFMIFVYNVLSVMSVGGYIWRDLIRIRLW